MILTDIAIKNRTSVAVLTVLIVIFGAISYLTLPREAAPDVPIPFVLVTSTYNGVSPEDVESSITMKIEKKLQGLKGVKEVTSASAEGTSMIQVEFLPGIRPEDAMQYVRDKVDQARGELPTSEEFKEPVLREINVAEFPIMMVNITATISPVQLKKMADDLADVIETVPGVLEVGVLGAQEREIRIEIDQDLVAAYGLTILELMKLIPSENVNVSAGGLETPGSKFNVRVPAEFVQPDEVGYLLLTVRNGRPIYLTDVARISDTFKDPSSFSRVDGRTSVTLSIQKRIGADIIPLVDAIKRILAEAKMRVPAGTEFQITMDRSRDIKLMVADLENNMAAAFVLVMVILMIFLGLRTSVIVAMAVPLTVLMSVGLLQAMGFTLNMIVLFSLVLAVGMMVDDAIVIVENIYRHMQLGYGRIDSAIKGTSEVAWPVITSTLTTNAAFLPMLFWPGMIGDFMKYLPITVIVCLSCSAFVALIINPVICTIFGGAVRARSKGGGFLDKYRSLLRLSIDHRYATLALCGLIMLSMVMLYVRFGHGIEFFPNIDPKRAVINVRCPQGTNVKYSDNIARQIEDRIGPYGRYFEHVITNVGAGGSANAMFTGGAGGPHMANISITFPDFEKRTRDSLDVIMEIRKKLGDITGGEVKIDPEKKGPPTGAPVTVRFIGEDLRELERLSEQGRHIIMDVPGLVNLRSDFEATRPEIVFIPDRQQAMLLGVNTAIIGNFLKTAVFGSKVGVYRQFNDEYDITVRLPQRQRSRLDDLVRLSVPNAQGLSVPLSILGRFEYRGGMGTINRINQKRVVTLTADAEGRQADEVLKDVQARLATIRLPSGYDIRYAGEKEEQDKSQVFLGKAFIFALLLITLIMVAEFNTLSVPLIIMSTVALSWIGVLLGLLVTKTPYGVIMTGIGVISLAGVVVKNGIVLMDFTRQLQKRGLGLIEACVEAGAVRLRPVLLTAACTVIGLLPTALGMAFDFHTFEWVTKSESSAWWKPMAVAVIFGLSLATMLTLVVVPTLYVIVFRLVSRFGWGGLKKVEAESDGKSRACNSLRLSDNYRPSTIHCSCPFFFPQRSLYRSSN
ncbi:MAG: efflux RND transporter permease subunit [Planctomycetes bacterium]|nr:efflux RND transporter permease subunit [Planctomycetota bacterium]